MFLKKQNKLTRMIFEKIRVTFAPPEGGCKSHANLYNRQRHNECSDIKKVFFICQVLKLISLQLYSLSVNWGVLRKVEIAKNVMPNSQRFILQLSLLLWCFYARRFNAITICLYETHLALTLKLGVMLLFWQHTFYVFSSPRENAGVKVFMKWITSLNQSC